MKHPHVWVLTDDMYEHLVYDDFDVHDAGAGRAAALRPHADDQRRVEGLLHDRLAHRLCRRARSTLIKAMATMQSQSTSNPPSISQWAAVEALNGPQDFIPKNNKIFKERRDLVRLDAQPGERHPVPEAGRRVLRLSVLRRHHRQDGAVRQEDRDRRGFRRPSCSRRKASRWCTARRSASARPSASPTRRDDRGSRRPAARIQRFCGNLK